MSEAAINRRKSQLFLTTISPVYDTHDELVKKKLKKGKFPQTKTGIIKMISLCLQLGSIISWIVLQPECDSLGILYSFLGSNCLGFVGHLFFFLMLSFGKIVKDPAPWIYSDIGFNLIISLIVIIISALSLKRCQFSDVENLSSVLAISGASTSICGCAALFLMYRFVEDSETEQHAPTRLQHASRKSIFA